MKHLGDFDASAVLYGKFTTYRPSTGAAYTLAGSPVLSVYKDNSTTQSTTGVTMTADFDSVTGLNHFAIDTSADGTFYAAGSFFDIVITTGTVDSVSVVGSVVGSFTIRKNSALKPATAGRTLVVDASGLADANAVKVGPTGSGTAQTARDIGASVLLSNGTGTGQVSLASGVVSANAVQISGDATAADNLETAYDDTAGSVPWSSIVDQGTAQSATGTTLVLRATAAFADSELVGAIIVITGGSAGVGQARAITGFVGGTDTATVDAWTTTPTGTITYKIFAAPPGPSTPIPVNVTQFGGTNGTFSSGRPEVNTSHVAGTSQTAGDIIGDTNDIQTRLPAALVSGRIDASVGAMAANVLTATAINADAITAAKVASDVSAEIADQVWDEIISGHAGVGSTGAALSAAGGSGDPWATALPGSYGSGTAGKIVGDNINATVSSRAAASVLGAAVGASISADIAAVKTDTAAVKVQTDKLTFTVANQVDSNVLDWKSATAPAMTGDAFARLGAPSGASVSADVAAIKVDTAAVKAKTDNLPSDPADASDIAASLTTIAGYIDTEVAAIYSRLGAPAGASISADVAAVKAVLPAALVSGRIDASVGAMAANVMTAAAAASDLTTELQAGLATPGDIPSAASIATATTAKAIEGAYTVADLLRITAAVAAGKTSITDTGGGTATVVFRDVADAEDRVTADMDASERVDVTLNPS